MGRRRGKWKRWTAGLGHLNVAGGITSLDHGRGDITSVGFVCKDNGYTAKEGGGSVSCCAGSRKKGKRKEHGSVDVYGAADDVYRDAGYDEHFAGRDSDAVW